MNQRPASSEPSGNEPETRLAWHSIRRPEAILLAIAVLFAGTAWTWRLSGGAERESQIEVGERKPLDAKVMVNELDASGLTVIPGVGEKLAASIVEERAKGGRFAGLDDLESRVKGFRRSRVAEFERFLDFGIDPEEEGAGAAKK